ncbi:MAG: hypothetical protein ACRD2A_02850 [Vicinamibacterales bacterium]
MMRRLLVAFAALGLFSGPAMADSFSCTVLIGTIGNVAHTGLGIGGCYLIRLASDGTIIDIEAPTGCKIYSGSNHPYERRHEGESVVADDHLFAVCNLPVLQEEVSVTVE